MTTEQPERPPVDEVTRLAKIAGFTPVQCKVFIEQLTRFAETLQPFTTWNTSGVAPPNRTPRTPCWIKTADGFITVAYPRTHPATGVVLWNTLDDLSYSAADVRAYAVLTAHPL